MEYTSIAAVVIYALLFAFMAIVIPVAIVFNIKAGAKYREKLALQLKQLRIGNMLNALGIDITRYLHQERIHEINTQMSRCSECKNTDQCDEELSSGNIDPENIRYCNNEQDLQRIAAKQKQAH